MKQNFLEKGSEFLKGLPANGVFKISTRILVCFMFFLIADSLSAQTEIQTTITTFFNDVMIPVGSVLVAIGTFCGLVYSAMLFSQGSPNAKKVLIGVIVAAIVFYGGGLLLTNLFANFGSSYTISFLEGLFVPSSTIPLPALV